MTTEANSPSHWTETFSHSVLLVIRPDVPGHRYNPESVDLLKTDQAREEFRLALDALHTQIELHSGKPPEWYEAL